MLLLVLMMGIIGCKEDDLVWNLPKDNPLDGNTTGQVTPPGAPVVTTASASNVSLSSADLEGNITDLGDGPVTQHGHCWSTATNPTVSNSKTTLGPASATGTYSSSLTGLSNGTTYYVRAYATNTYGTSYGGSLTITTHFNPIADFNTSATNVLVWETVYFLDLSQYSPTNWSWIAAGATPDTSSQQNPTFQYNAIGKFDVQLTASNQYGSDTELKSEYISVEYCEYFTGGFNDWANNGWSTTSSLNVPDGNGLYAWGGNSSTPITFTLTKTFTNVPSGASISFWYYVYSPSGDLSIKLDSVNIWSATGSSGSSNETVALPQGGNLNIVFESILIGTQTVYLDNICIVP